MFYFFSKVPENILRIKLRILTASAIFKTINTFSYALIIIQRISTLKYMFFIYAVQAKYLRILPKLLPALAAARFSDILYPFLAVQTSFSFSDRNNTIADRAASWEKEVFYLFSIISKILSFNPVYLLCSFSFAIICITVLRLPRIVTQFFALVTPVYKGSDLTAF